MASRGAAAQRWWLEEEQHSGGGQGNIVYHFSKNWYTGIRAPLVPALRAMYQFQRAPGSSWLYCGWAYSRKGPAHGSVDGPRTWTPEVSPLVVPVFWQRLQ